jgi:hypothetical protein
MQPARVRTVRGRAGEFEVDIERRARLRKQDGLSERCTRLARVIVDAHGSWEPPPAGLLSMGGGARGEAERAPAKASDLFAFKTSFSNAALSPGLLPVISLDGGYGGIVLADGGRTTLACCIRRDRLRSCRVMEPGAPAGAAVADFLYRSCAGVRQVLAGARQVGPWLSVGPIRPGIRVEAVDVFRVGNAAGESHPLIGEGIGMALHSAHLLAQHLSRNRVEAFDSKRTPELKRRYAKAWRGIFAPRIRFAAAAAHAVMHPALSGISRPLIARHPAFLTWAARWAGKAEPAIIRSH